MTVRLLDPLTVAVDMGEPDFEPARIPFDAPHRAERYPLDVDGAPVTVGAVSMGNPHAVIQVDDLHAPALERLGPQITAHPRFPEGCNAGFVRVVDERHLRLRVHERGSGWTQACGSGACAAMAVLRMQGRVERQGRRAPARRPPGHRLEGSRQAAVDDRSGCLRVRGHLHAARMNRRRDLFRPRADGAHLPHAHAEPDMADMTLKDGLQAMDVADYLRRQSRSSSRISPTWR